MIERRHLLAEVVLDLDYLMLRDGPLSMILVPQNAIIGVPDLQRQGQLHPAVLVYLKGQFLALEWLVFVKLVRGFKG